MRLLVVAAAVVAAVSACGAAGESGPTAVGSSSPAQVLVVSATRYASAPEGWRDPTLDLYVPAEAGPRPLAVVVPDPGGDPRQDPARR